MMTVLSERIYNSLDAGGEMRAIALDISKAFAKVWHAGMPQKLKAYSVVYHNPKYLGFFFVGTFIERSRWPVFTSLYHQCWSSSGIRFGTNLIPGFY